MVESEKRPTVEEPSPNPEERRLLKDVYGSLTKGKNQKTAIEILDTFPLEFEDREAIFFYHIWQEDGKLESLKKFEEGKNRSEIIEILNRLRDSDELTEQYDDFQERYKLKVKERKY